MPPPDSAACQEGTVRPAVPVALLSHRGRWYHSCGPGTRDGAREPGRTGRVPARSSVGSGREGPPRQSDRLTPCDGGSRRGTWLSGRHKSEVPGTPGPAVPVRSAPGVATPRPLASPTFHTPGPAPQGPLSPREPSDTHPHPKSCSAPVAETPAWLYPLLAARPPASKARGPRPPRIYREAGARAGAAPEGSWDQPLPPASESSQLLGRGAGTGSEMAAGTLAPGRGQEPLPHRGQDSPQGPATAGSQSWRGQEGAGDAGAEPGGRGVQAPRPHPAAGRVGAGGQPGASQVSDRSPPACCKLGRGSLLSLLRELAGPSPPPPTHPETASPHSKRPPSPARWRRGSGSPRSVQSQAFPGLPPSSEAFGPSCPLLLLPEEGGAGSAGGRGSPGARRRGPPPVG